MYRNSILLMFALAVALVANVTSPMNADVLAAGHNSGASASEAQDNTSRVGLVVAYTVEQSITIMDRDGNQFTFTLAPAPDLKIVPANRAGMLRPGAYVTIIAPNNVPNGKQIAVGIVIHPGIPEGFPLPTQTTTPAPTDTLVTTATSVETPTSAETATSTETIAVTDTPTATPEVVGTITETPTAGVTSVGTFTKDQIATILDAIGSFLRQLLSRGNG